jgi:hypothetical protein
VTEFGDLVCPICRDYAVSSEEQLISTEVATGKVKLVWRGDDTASSYYNQAGYTPSQMAIRSAGLQGKAWYYILTAYELQPADINGVDAEDVFYMTTHYLQQLASQIQGLNTTRWQDNLTNSALQADVQNDLTAAQAQCPHGTPCIYVSGAKGNVQYDASDQLSAVPTLAQLQALIKQVS